MMDVAHHNAGDAAHDGLVTSPDFNMQIANLRAAGAEQFDPVRLHYLEVLTKRTMSHQGSVKRMLDTKLANELAMFKERFELARSNAQETITRAAEQFPHAASELQQRFSTGDFKGLQRFVDTLSSTQPSLSLRMLVRQLEHHALENGEARLKVNSPTRPELKTIRNFRKTWSKLSSGKQVTQALEQAPKNAGPINSHMLVLRSLALMRDISPDYLNRFMSYADTLLCLDQCEKEKPVTTKKSPTGRAGKK